MGAYRQVLELRAARMVFVDAGSSDQSIETQLALARQVDAAAAACESDVADVGPSARIIHSRSASDACTEGKRCRTCERLFSGEWMTAVRETQSMRAAVKAAASYTYHSYQGASRAGLQAALVSGANIYDCEVHDRSTDRRLELGMVRIVCTVESRIARDATIGNMHELDVIRRDICQVLWSHLAAGIGVHELVFRDEERRPFISLSGPNIQPPGGAFIMVSP